MLAGCETAVRLGCSGLKNVLALSLALAKNNKQISGKVNLGRMLRETRDLRTFPMTKEQYRQFAKTAKPQKLLYSVIRDKNNGEIEVALPVTELERANLILEKMLYNLPEQKPPEEAVEQMEPREPAEPEVEQEQAERREPQEPEVEAVQPESLEPEQAVEIAQPENIRRSQTEKSEQLAIPLQPESKRENDAKKESRLASDLNATKPSSSIWKESGNIMRTISERVSIEERLRKFKAQIDAARGLEPTRTRTKNKEQVR